MEFKEFIENYDKRIHLLKSIFGKKELKLYFDNLNKLEQIDHEQIFCECTKGTTTPSMYVFGFNFFLKELEEEEFKRSLSLDPMNFKIHHAYAKLLKKQKKVKIADILHEIQDGKKDSIEINKILSKILSLSYYFDWKLIKDRKDIEHDSFIEIPAFYLVKLIQRYDLEPLAYIYENADLFMFINKRGNLNVVLKQDYFNKTDILEKLVPVFRKVFEIKTLSLE